MAEFRDWLSRSILCLVQGIAYLGMAGVWISVFAFYIGMIAVAYGLLAMFSTYVYALITK